jgi:2-hydroxychromene-2-carboxylate isomerase
VTALRLALLAGDRVGELSLALFRAAWVDDRNLDDEATLRDILGRLDLDADRMLAQTRDPATKQALIDNTARAAASGIFGAPTFLVSRGGEPRLYFGQDRLELAVRAASGALSR